MAVRWFPLACTSVVCGPALAVRPSAWLYCARRPGDEWPRAPEVQPPGPLMVLAILYITTAVLTEVMSNNAAAVLLAPIALSLAAAMGVSARPFLVAITFAASTSFATPVGYQTNTMVYAPGGYRFADYTKVGGPLNLIFRAS